MLPHYLIWLALFLLMTIVAGLAWIRRAPKPADRMLGIQLFGTTSVAVLLLLAEAGNHDALRNVALVFTLLSLLVLVAFIARIPPGNVESEDGR